MLLKIPIYNKHTGHSDILRHYRYLYVRSTMALWLICLTVHMRAVLEAVEVEVEAEAETVSSTEATRRTANGSGTR
jgi:hypothetical protein